jgi:hypothetical protein
VSVNRIIISGIALLVGAVVAVANSTGPPLAHTGAPRIDSRNAEPTCNTSGCHQGNPMNSNGTLEILGLPATYSPGATYPATVRLTSTATQGSVTRRWGFEITAVRLSDGLGSGTFTSPGLRIETFNGRTYVTHQVDDLHPGEAGPAEWTMSWTAPAQDEGDIGFYAAGNAANGNATATGDFIYTTSETTMGPGVPVEPVTWGRIKSLYVD